MEILPLVRPPKSKCLKSAHVTLAPGEEVGEHTTEKREEVITILRGEAMLAMDGEIISLSAGESHFIPEGTKHNVKNKFSEPLEYVYVVSIFV
jgi:mannose-6-phosphate isomerase-like protein (cupin superfamily)